MGVLLAAFLVLAAPALAGRGIPVGGANVNDQNLSSAGDRLAVRFVLDQDTTVYRFISGFKAQGASWWPTGSPVCAGPGSGCYGAGDGGTINAQLVTVRADGTPDLGNVLAQDTARAQDRYRESIAALGVPSGYLNQLWYWNMGGVQLRANTMYAMVYRNVAADPLHNFSSVNSPVMKESEAGPNGRNTLDPNAAGAVAGLDPREALAWSPDGGTTWTWGRETGHYFGSSTSDDGTRLPWYGWQASPTTAPQSNQPYYNYWSTCTGCTLVSRNVPRATTLTQAGGYAPVGARVGVVTVRNVRTGQSGRTGDLGSGLARGGLDVPVAVQPGDTYTTTTTGTVYKNPADMFIRTVFGVGSGPWPFSTDGFGSDRAELFALPHPYYGANIDPGPAPAPAPAPAATTTPTTGTGSTSTAGKIEKARGRRATASSLERVGLDPSMAVDGATTTRWSSSFSDGQWWQVDLGEVRAVDTVAIRWEDAFASRYRIATSTDGVDFRTATDVTIDRAGLRTTSFALTRARYVRVVGVSRATRYGISFWDVAVLGPPDATSGSGTTAIASSARAASRSARTRGTARRCVVRARTARHRTARRRAALHRTACRRAAARRTAARRTAARRGARRTAARRTAARRAARRARSRARRFDLSS